MTLKEILEAFEDLNEQETAKVRKGLYIETLKLVQTDIKDIINYLHGLGIKIKYAREIKVGTVPSNEIKEKIDNLRSVDAIDLAIQHPLVLTVNDKCLGMRKRIIKCKQDNVAVKDEEGKYLSFIYEDEEWAKKQASLSQIIDEYDKEHPNKEISNEEKEEKLKKADEIIKEISPVSEPEAPSVIKEIDNEFSFSPDINWDEELKAFDSSMNSTPQNDDDNINLTSLMDNDTPNKEEVEKASQDLSAIEDAKAKLESTKKALRNALDSQIADMNFDVPEEDGELSFGDWNPDEELGRGGR